MAFVEEPPRFLVRFIHVEKMLPPLPGVHDLLMADLLKMPPEVLKKLHDAMVKVTSDPATVKRFADLTAQTKSSTPEELAAMLDKEEKLVVPLIKKLGIKAE